MHSWRRVFTSDEARIESLAGASPCEWLPMPETDWPMPEVEPWAEEESDDPSTQ